MLKMSNIQDSFSNFKKILECHKNTHSIFKVLKHDITQNTERLSQTQIGIRAKRPLYWLDSSQSTNISKQA